MRRSPPDLIYTLLDKTSEASFSMADVQRLLDHDDRVKEAVSHSHESFRDARIRAAFAIAPVLGPVMTKASLAEVRVPVRIIVGSKDDQAFPDVNARPIASSALTLRRWLPGPGNREDVMTSATA